MKSRRKFSREFKQTAIRQTAGGKVRRRWPGHWKCIQAAFIGGGASRTNTERRRSRVEAESVPNEDRVSELEREVGRQAPEIDFLKRALQHVEEQRLLRALSNGTPSTSRPKKK